VHYCCSVIVFPKRIILVSTVLFNLFVCMCVCVCVWVLVCTNIHTYIHVYIHTYVRVCTYIHVAPEPSGKVRVVISCSTGTNLWIPAVAVCLIIQCRINCFHQSEESDMFRFGKFKDYVVQSNNVQICWHLTFYSTVLLHVLYSIKESYKQLYTRIVRYKRNMFQVFANRNNYLASKYFYSTVLLHVLYSIKESYIQESFVTNEICFKFLLTEIIVSPLNIIHYNLQILNKRM
jgi:hypothetical protein